MRQRYKKGNPLLGVLKNTEFLCFWPMVFQVEVLFLMPVAVGTNLIFDAHYYRD